MQASRRTSATRRAASAPAAAMAPARAPVDHDPIRELPPCPVVLLGSRATWCSPYAGPHPRTSVTQIATLGPRFGIASAAGDRLSQVAATIFRSVPLVTSRWVALPLGLHVKRVTVRPGFWS